MKLESIFFVHFNGAKTICIRIKPNKLENSYGQPTNKQTIFKINRPTPVESADKSFPVNISPNQNENSEWKLTETVIAFYFLRFPSF